VAACNIAPATPWHGFSTRVFHQSTGYKPVPRSSDVANVAAQQRCYMLHLDPKTAFPAQEPRSARQGHVAGVANVAVCNIAPATPWHGFPTRVFHKSTGYKPVPQ